MGRVSRGEIAAYALPALPLAVLTLPLYVLVPAFYARELMLPIAAVGSALLIVRIVDALADPLTGLFADRWRPAYGRRRLWLLAASLPTALCAYLVFTPPAGAGLLYLTFWGVILSIASTAALVPYAAWGAELVTDYTGRARVTAWRETFALIGTLLALFAQVLVPAAGFSGDGAVLFALGLFTLLILPLASLVCVAHVPEPQDHSKKPLPLKEGLALGADLVLPPAIQADVIDVDTAATGEQRSGLYFAAWGLATKLALALAVGIAFPLLGAAGFDPAAGLREDSGLVMLGFLYAGLPIVLKIAAAALMWHFPIDAAMQARLRAQIEGA